MQFKFFTILQLYLTQALETSYLLSQVLWLQMFFNGNWPRKSPLSGNNEQVILADLQIKAGSYVGQRS